MSAGSRPTRSISKRARAAMPALPRVRSRRSITAIRSISTNASRTGRASKRAATSRAIDFDRGERARSERFDLVLDLSAEPLIRLHQPPQGYLAPGRDPLAQAARRARARATDRASSKSRSFSLTAKISARTAVRASPAARNASTSAPPRRFSPDGDHVKVEPHLCMGCGACASVCPSGAMSIRLSAGGRYWSRAQDAARRPMREAGGKAACVVFHNATDGREADCTVWARARQRPAGAGDPAGRSTSRRWVSTPCSARSPTAPSRSSLSRRAVEAPDYIVSLKRELGYAQQILTALGYGERSFHARRSARRRRASRRRSGHCRRAADRAACSDVQSVERKAHDARFRVRPSAEACAAAREQIALPSGAPYGADHSQPAERARCAWRAWAPARKARCSTAKDRPQLKFIERNCVQCGLCAKTCPEDAIALAPRLLLTRQAKAEAVLNEAEIFGCIKCGKPFATQQMIDNMLARLGTHSMFTEAGALERLQDVRRLPRHRPHAQREAWLRTRSQMTDDAVHQSHVPKRGFGSRRSCARRPLRVARQPFLCAALKRNIEQYCRQRCPMQ